MDNDVLGRCSLVQFFGFGHRRAKIPLEHICTAVHCTLAFSKGRNGIDVGTNEVLCICLQFNVKALTYRGCVLRSPYGIAAS